MGAQIGHIRQQPNALEHIIVTGHSLGGGLASLCSLASEPFSGGQQVEQVEGVTFNAAALRKLMSSTHPTADSASVNSIRAYIVSDEILDNVQHSLFNRRASGRIEIIDANSPSSTEFDRHGLFLKALLSFLASRP